MMPIIVLSLVLCVAVLHVYVVVLEMFLWTKPLGRRVFGTSQQMANDSAVLAKNQGLYNGFLAAGLFWSVFARDPERAFDLRVFFLSCVFLAGAYAGVTANRRIFFVQGLPALITLILLFLATSS